MRRTLLETLRGVKRDLGCLLAAAVLIGTSPLAAVAVDMPAAERPVGALSSPIGDVDYTPGRGLRLGDTGVTLGGYSNLNLTRPEGGPARLGLDDLSLFVTWNLDARVHVFSELEFEDLGEVLDDGRGGSRNHSFTAERVYADFALTDQLNLRVGKFLTPVGRWNVIHAQPLVWTASRPLITELPFDPHVTGAMLFGDLAAARGTLTYSVFGQVTNQLERVPTPQPAQRSAGARLEYANAADWSVGASYLAAENHADWRHVTGVDGLWRHGPFEVMGELTIEDAERRAQDQWGLYLQGVVEVLPRVSLVLRYERYERRRARNAIDMVIGGIAYKPWPWLVLKSEYDAADHRAEESPPGFRASVAVLF